MSRKKTKEPDLWTVLGVLGALGGEFVLFVLGALILGRWLDERFGSDPWGVLSLLVIALIGLGTHLMLIAKRFMHDGD